MSALSPAGLARAARALALRLPLLYLALFFFYPLLAISAVSFLRDGQLDLAALTRILTRPYYRERLLFTLGQAALSTLLTLALALPAAHALATYRFRGKGALLALATLPFVLPTVVVAAAFKALLGDAGLLNRALMDGLSLSQPPLALERSLTLILLTHVFYNYAIALHILSGYWRTQTTRLEEAARALGCSPLRLWWEIRLPLLRPALLSAAALVFVFCFTSFGVVLLLGDVGRHDTLEVAIYRQVNIDLPTAATLSLTQSGLMFLMMLVYSRWSHVGGHTPALQSATSRERQPRTRAANAPGSARTWPSLCCSSGRHYWPWSGARSRTAAVTSPVSITPTSRDWGGIRCSSCRRSPPSVTRCNSRSRRCSCHCCWVPWPPIGWRDAEIGVLAASSCGTLSS